MTDIWEDEFDDGNFVSLKLGFEFITAGAFDELELGPLLDETAGQTVSPVVKAICMLLLSRPERAFDDLAYPIRTLPYQALLGSEVRLADFRYREVYKVYDSLGSLDLEALYRRCAQRAQPFLKSSKTAEGSADKSHKNVIFPASGVVQCWSNSSPNGGSGYRFLSFYALLDAEHKFPFDLCFAQLPENKAASFQRSNANPERRKSLIALLERADLAGSVLELGKPLNNHKEVLEAAHKAGVEVCLRQKENPLVDKPVRWSLLEYLRKEHLCCAPQTWNTQERVRAVCFIIAVSLILWSFLGVRVGEVCSRLQITDLFAMPESENKGAAAEQPPLTISAFHRQFHEHIVPELLISRQSGRIAFDFVSENLAAVVKELGPCYQRYLSAETYNGRQLSEDF